MIYHPVVLYLKIQRAGQSLLFSSLAELPASSSNGTGFTATPPSLEKRAGSNLSKDARHSWAQGSESSSTKLGRVLMHGCMTSYLAGQKWTHSVTLSPVHQKQSLLNKGRAGPQEYIPLLLPHEGQKVTPKCRPQQKWKKTERKWSTQTAGLRSTSASTKRNARKRKSQSTDSSLGNFWGNSACPQSTLMTIRGIRQCVISPSLQILFMWTSCEHFYCTLFHLFEPRASHTPGTTPPLNYIPVSSLAFIDNA